MLNVIAGENEARHQFPEQYEIKTHKMVAEHISKDASGQFIVKDLHELVVAIMMYANENSTNT